MDWLDNVLATEHSQPERAGGSWASAHDLPVRCDPGPLSSRGSSHFVVPSIAVLPEAEQRTSAEARHPESSRTPRRRSRASLGQEFLLQDGDERSTGKAMPRLCSS